MPRVRKILIVENDPAQLRPRKELFERQGWQVLTANNLEAAREILTSGWVHLAIVDLRLKDEDDPNDFGGLDLIIEETDPVIPKIIWTAYPTFEVVNKALGLGPNGVPLAVNFVDKAKGFKVLLEAVNAAFTYKVRINVSLVVEPSPGVSFPDLVRQIKAYRKLPNDRIDIMAEELEDVLRKLFPDADHVTLKHMTAGAGGSGVVQIQPTSAGVKGADVVVKFGRRDNMRKEIGNFLRYVQPYAGQLATAMMGTMEETSSFGAARFSLVGQAGGAPHSFTDFYRKASADEIRQVLRFLFENTCARWYAGKHDWTDPELDHRPELFDAGRLRDRPDVLAVAFEEQKSFDTEERRDELRQAMQRAFMGNTLYKSHLRKVDESQFEVTFSGPPEKTFRLPDPLDFIKTQRCGFSRPTFWAITHGDLHGGNILVDENGYAWLIDFYKTGWGPALRDFAQLEAAIRMELMETDNLFALSQFEVACLNPRQFDKGIGFNNIFQIGEFDKAIQVITYLRELAMKVAETSSMKEYYIGLLYHTLKLSTWEGSLPQERELDVRQRHALISAGLICDRLKRWYEEDWKIVC